MTFMRIWTALLASSYLALVSTLVYAIASGIVGSQPIDRQALYDVFLLAWLLMTLVCAVPARPLSQWLVAVRVSAGLFGTLFLLTLATDRDPATLAATALSAGLLILLNYALPRSPTLRGAKR